MDSKIMHQKKFRIRNIFRLNENIVNHNHYLLKETGFLYHFCVVYCMCNEKNVLLEEVCLKRYWF